MRKMSVVVSLFLTLTVLAFLPYVSADDFPSNKNLAERNVAIKASGFGFASGLNLNESGKPNGKGLELIGISWVGSGFVVEPDGTVVTNYHVARRALKVQAVFQSGATFEVPFIKVYDPVNDIAILKIAGVDNNFQVVTLGNSDTVEVRDPVLAVGNPLGMGINITEGKISQIVYDKNENRFSFRHTATIAPGNSGGALYKGNDVIGINVRGTPPYEFYEAIPINKAKTLISQYSTQKILWSDAFPTDIQRIAQKSKQVVAQNGTVAAATDAQPGTVSISADLYPLEDILIILEAQKGSDLAIVVQDYQSGKVIALGDAIGINIDGVLIESDNYKQIVIAVVNYEKQSANFGISLNTIQW